MVSFFRSSPSFINCKDGSTKSSPLHTAARLGHTEMVGILLEFGANIDQTNILGQSPLFSAVEGLHQKTAHLLIEWGCDVHLKDDKNRTAFDTIKNDEFRDTLIDIYRRYSTIVPQIMIGNSEALNQVFEDHVSGKKRLCSLRSRFINGSTFLHTAAYFGEKTLIRKLLNIGLDINLLDYKGAVALHRAKDSDTLRVLTAAGAEPDITDFDGNTPLHVKCYGDTGKPSAIDCVKGLIDIGAKLTIRNHKQLLPIHCCAMQGRVDLIQILMEAEGGDEMLKSLADEEDRNPPSLPHLALANDYLNAAEWLLNKEFCLKRTEPEILIQRIITEKIKVSDKVRAIKLLIQFGADPNHFYEGTGYTALHYAASVTNSNDLLEVLVDNGAEITAGAEYNSVTPLHIACQVNNRFAAAYLISKGADCNRKDGKGLTPYDYIIDYEEWIDSGNFTDETCAILKAFNLKHTRDLIRAISNRVRIVPSLAGSPQPAIISGWSSVSSARKKSARIRSRLRSSTSLPAIRKTNSGRSFVK